MVTRTLGRKPLSWPFKVIGWLVLGVTILVLVGLAAGAGAGMYYEVTRTTAGDVDGMIEAELRNGSTTNQVVAFLDRHRIEHGAVEPANAADPRLEDVDVPEGASTVSGMIRNDGYSLRLVDVQMTFVLNAEGKLEDWVVWEVKR